MKHTWTYANIGGNLRVVVKSGKDIEHLASLDEKLWTVLSCPTSGLEIAEESLRHMDVDGDGKIHITDVVATADWLCKMLRDPQVLFDAKPSLQLKDIADVSVLSVASSLAENGQVTLKQVKNAIGSVSVESQPLPAIPYSADVIAAYKACQDAYSQYFHTAKLQSLGLATIPADAVVPGMTEDAFIEMGAKIAEYETSKSAIEATNAAALTTAQAQYLPLEKLLLLCRDYCTLLRNFVSFQDFYAKRGKALLGRGDAKDESWAIFQAGTLVIDQRACNLCLKVTDMTKHNVQAPDSGMYLIYCNCTHQATAQKMQIVAAMTVGGIRNLKVGKNALFYDRQGRDWEAEVIKIIDNPISIGQAFYSPYRKLGDWISGLINKSASEKEKKAFAELTTKVPADITKPAPAAEKVQPFDIAKFAGIFAAIGMAVGYIGSFLTTLAMGIGSMKWWALLIIPTLLLVISGPSMILAWMKLRRRNLAPLLNANGWAVNADALVSVLFGNTLTEQAQYPLMKMKDPFAKKGLSKTSKWFIALVAIVVGLIVAAISLYLCGFRMYWCCV